MAETGKPMTRDERMVRHIAELSGWYRLTDGTWMRQAPGGTIYLRDEPPPYLASDADALEALEAWRNAGQDLERFYFMNSPGCPGCADELFTCTVDSMIGNQFGADADTLSLAIVAALCKATGFQEPPTDAEMREDES